jgi:hypothetical protein
VSGSDVMLPPGCLVADLIEQLKEVWRANGVQIIQALDANSDIYNGHRHPAFSASPINMNCMMEEAMDTVKYLSLTSMVETKSQQFLALLA